MQQSDAHCQSGVIRAAKLLGNLMRAIARDQHQISSALFKLPRAAQSKSINPWHPKHTHTSWC